jgi:hypothetical protein
LIDGLVVPTSTTFPPCSFAILGSGEPFFHVSLARRLQHTINGGSRLKRSTEMIRKLNSGKYRLYSRKADPRTGKRRNLGTFDTRAAAEKHERAVQYFKHH